MHFYRSFFGVQLAIGSWGGNALSFKSNEIYCCGSPPPMWVAPVAVDISQLNWGCTLWSTLVHSGLLWSTQVQPGSGESKPQSITYYDHQDLLRQVKTWFKRKPKVKKCKSAFGKNYLGECVAQAKVDFWHFCSVSDCEDCDLCNNAGISLPVSPASPAAQDGMSKSMYC